MEKWSYKYSFISGILFLTSFLLKELILFSPNGNNWNFLILPYIFMIFFLILLLAGYLKYAILNEKKLLKLSSVLLSILYSVIILDEFLERVFNLSSISYHFILLPKTLLTLSLIYFGIALILQKKIYGKRTIFQGIVSILFSFSILVPPLLFYQLPLFLMFFISIIYVIKKKEVDE